MCTVELTTCVTSHVHLKQGTASLSIKNSFICIFFFILTLLSRIVSRYKACVLSTTSGRQFYRDFPIDFVLSRAAPTMFFSHVRSFQLTIPRLFPLPIVLKRDFSNRPSSLTPIVSVISPSRVRKLRINRRRKFLPSRIGRVSAFPGKAATRPGKVLRYEGINNRAAFYLLGRRRIDLRNKLQVLTTPERLACTPCNLFGKSRRK